jgi:uncharacterized protein CbrC (UPF0167 family)
MTLPTFRYHPDPIRSGSIVESGETCRCCEKGRGYIYSGPVYAEEDLDDAICPWCIADGSAQEMFDASFVDTEAFPDSVPESAMEEISLRTPGYNAWQSEQWPACCGDATAFLTPAGIQEIREHYRELEGSVLNYIVYEMEISGGAATRMLQSLHKDKGPTAFLFRCLHCERHHLYVDQP